MLITVCVLLVRTPGCIVKHLLTDYVYVYKIWHNAYDILVGMHDTPEGRPFLGYTGEGYQWSAPGRGLRG